MTGSPREILDGSIQRGELDTDMDIPKLRLGFCFFWISVVVTKCLLLAGYVCTVITALKSVLQLVTPLFVFTPRARVLRAATGMRDPWSPLR